MGVLGQSRGKGAAVLTPPLQAPVDKKSFLGQINQAFLDEGAGERAGFRQAVAGPHSTRNGDAIYQSRSYDQIVQALNSEGERATDFVPSPVRVNSPLYHPVPGEQVQPDGRVLVPVSRPFTNPFAEAPSLTRDVNPVMNFYGGGDQAEISSMDAAIKRVQARKPGFLSWYKGPETISALADQHRKRDLAASQSTLSHLGTAGTIGSFAGGMAGSLAAGDVENFVGGIGGAIGAAGKTFARTVIKRAVEGAGANAAASLVATPGQMADAQHLGQPMTIKDVLHQTEQAATIGAVFGGAHVILPKVPGALADASRAVVDTAAKVPAVRDALVARSIAAGTINDHTLLNDWQRTHNPGGIVDTSTPEERAAAHVIVRDATTKELSPLHPDAAPQNDHRFDALAQSLGMNLSAPELPTPAPVQTPTVQDHSAGAAAPQRPAQFSEAINRAEGSTRNPRSSADGYGNFIDSTWLSVAPKVTDTAGLSRDQILALRHDKAIAGRATDYYAAQNASYLHARGLEDSPGNLSLAHFLGPDGAAKLLKADPATPVENLLPAKVIAANHEVLRGKSADQVIAWAHKRVGAAVDHPPARPDAVPDEGYDAASPVPYTVEEVHPNDMPSFERTPPEEPWNPNLAQHALIWEGADGRRELIDGAKRFAHAQSAIAEDDSVRVPAVVLRETDGVSEEMARAVAAMKSAALGTGTLEQRAAGLADMPEAVDLLRRPEGQREVADIAQLPYEDFGAVVNGEATLPSLEGPVRSGAWTVVDRETGRPVLETPDPAVASRVDQSHYEVIPSYDWLARYNAAVRDAGGVEPKPADLKKLVGKPREVANGLDTGRTEDSGSAGQPPGGEGRDLAPEAAPALVSASNGSLYDHAVAARDAAERFSDPVGEGAKAQTALLEHDLRMDAEPETAERPPPLFDLPETGFRLSEEGDPRSLKDILDEADADEAAAQAIRDCLK